MRVLIEHCTLYVHTYVVYVFQRFINGRIRHKRTNTADTLYNMYICT